MDLALFDFDGTITTRETFPDFVRRAVPPGRQRWGGALLAPLVAGYRLGLVPGTTVRAAIVRIGLKGLPWVELEAHGEAFARQVLAQALRVDAMRRVDWHRERGDTVVVVSGALDAYLRPWCESHALPVLCSALEVSDGRLTGRYDGPQCVLEEKARRVRANYDPGRFERIHAYGDTPEDAPLLAMAHERWYRGRRVGAGGSPLSGQA
ncbi:HAD family hydrolase [Lysobacter sp. A3-1-A15]|uniref:HAD family hydrolase n=1 Tax=Novilysobacter viscosus TaxID=3098602 RepID=UPI002ED94FE0